VRRTTFTLAALLAALLALPAGAVTITIVNKDDAGKGLNDPTPATPVGGNPGTTIGEQRLNVFKKAAEIWGGILPGNVEIRVDASFQDLTCSSSSAVLGGTSPTFVESDFGGGALPGLWYVVAQASQMAGYDLEPADSYMTARFNAKLGQAGCLSGAFFYYGYDTNTPTSNVNLLTVTLHEFAHGLGFISLVDERDGTFCCGSQPQQDIFDAFTFDTTVMKSWNEMATDAERMASAVNTGNLVWTGASANAAGAAYLSNSPTLKVTAPAAAAGNYTVGTASFGAPLTVAGVSGTMIAATDAIEQGGSPTDACSSPLTNAGAVAGKIALVDRGGCNFTVKAANVQAAGGIGIVIVNNQDTGAIGMSGTDPTVTIPVVSVSLGDGAKLRSNLPATATIGRDAGHTAGMNTAGQMLLFAPNPVQAGSSVSHWDTSASPNLLLEPNINNDLPIGVDITTDSFRDMGWFNTSPPAQHLIVTLAGAGSGTVTSSPAGISCPGTCALDFAFSTSVTLTAAAAGGSNFAGWSGEGCSGTGTCTIGMSVARSVTATFGIGPPACSSFTLSPPSLAPASAAGSQAVTVTGVPSGCAGGSWTASGNGSWITVLPGSGSGPGSVTVSWSANPWASGRTGNATIAGNLLGVNQWGARRGDFNGDGQADFTVYRPGAGIWYALGASGAWTSSEWGAAGDVPAPAGYDGSGVTNVAVFRPSTGTWYVKGSSTTSWGVSGDIPVPGDYDGDGKADPAVFRPGTGTWFVKKSGGGTISTSWGVSGDTPVAGDFDGDLKADLAVVRSSGGVLTWFVLKSQSGYSNYDAVQWGVDGDVPAPADYDGDGKTDIAVFRPSTGVWYIRRSSDSGLTERSWGVSGDIPQPADYDGDGKADIAVYRPGNGAWHVVKSSDGTALSRNWGVSGDLPVTAPRY
jgi:hypothetical protein